MRADDQLFRSPLESIEDCLHKAKAAICDETARICVRRYCESLRAVVLTGSLARDEATFVEEGAYWRLLGDADFFLVFHEGARLPSVRTVESAGKEVEAALRQKGFIASLGLYPVHPSYFQRMPHHISSFELRSCGCTVWGDREVLLLVPAFSAEQISHEDAWRLLGNRIIELLEAISSGPERGDVLSRDARYRTIKLYLDMATSYLVFAGQYRPTYREREQALRRLANDESADAEFPFQLRQFAERVSDCTRFKLDGRGRVESPLKLWKDAVRFAHVLWRWELTRLTGETNELSDSALMSAWMEQQAVKPRIRGWASVFLRCEWRRSWREWPRWIRLGWRASPRFWVYGVATEIFFRLPCLLEDESGHTECDLDWTSRAARLPLPDQASAEPSGPEWQRLARLTALNYRLFVETTVS